MFNIYDFFNSRDIAEYCKSIGHTFTALEMAYIVWFSEYRTMNQKHSAWKQIIDNCPDEIMPKGKWKRTERSLHNFLKHYIQIETEYIEQFTKSDTEYIFNYGMKNISENDYYVEDLFFNSYDACIDDIRENQEEIMCSVCISKRRLYTSPHNDRGLVDTIYVNANMEVMSIESDTLNNDWAIADGFSEMWFNIPTPFQYGDLVTCNSVHGEKVGKFVLLYIPHWETDDQGRDMSWRIKRLKTEGGDWTDMQTAIYDVSDDSNIYWDHGPNYLFLEYCKDKPEGEERILLAVSDYLKKKIRLDELMSAQNALLFDQLRNRYTGEDIIIENKIVL